MNSVRADDWTAERAIIASLSLSSEAADEMAWYPLVLLLLMVIQIQMAF